MRILAAITATSALVLSRPALAQGEAQPATGGAFRLGQITVTAPRPEGLEIGGETLTAEAIRALNRNTLDDAVNVMPGISSANSGGSRNERLIFLRGFDRFQVPLSIDGVRVYLPADNRLDYGRFLTPDIAELQVAKGYASVLDGPGAMGGAINLVTRKPTREIESEVRGTLNLDRDMDYAGHTLYASLGTRHERWYAQASYARNEQDHWDLPGGFAPTATENGGARDFSKSKDWRVNVKLGFTPNATDEYAISYTRQEGSKNAPLHVTDPLGTQRFWNWPYWNIESIYFLSTTAIGDNGTIKTRIYRNTFDNLLRGFDNRTQTTQTLAVGRVFNSWYDDEAHGGSVQFDIASDTNRLSMAVHYRRDRHVEYQQTFGASGLTEPPQRNLEDIWSIAIEDEVRLAPALKLTLGASYDLRNLQVAEEFGTVPGLAGQRLFSYPIRDANAWNAQGQLVWTPDVTTRVHASVSSRARFPTIFERFSSRFGGATSNPDLKSERATNLELGAARDFGTIRIEGSVFYSHVDDVILAYPFTFSGQSVTQSRNVGAGDYHGVEIAMNGQLGPALNFGANYTYTHRKLSNPSIIGYRLTDVPEHKGFAYLSWKPVSRVTVLPSLDFASDRWTVTPATANGFSPTYRRTGSYAVANLRIDFELAEGIELGVGARNLFDDYYMLTDGFPEAGRSFFASARARF